MAKKIEDTLNKVGNTIEAILGTKKSAPTPVFTNREGGQSNLERIGMESRENHLRKNEWKKDLQYSKLLVESEYDIQKEFII